MDYIPLHDEQNKHLLKWYIVHANRRIPEVVGPFSSEHKAIEWGMNNIGYNSIEEFDWFPRKMYFSEPSITVCIVKPL